MPSFLSICVLLFSSWLVVSAYDVPAQYHVDLRVYFRAFCPACQWFVGGPMLELIHNEEFNSIVDLSLIPAAGMAEVNGALDCEGGELECIGHRWQVCVIEKDKNDVPKYLGNIACIEGDESGEVGDWDTKLKNCLTPEERTEVKKCFDTKSKDLLLKFIRKDNAGHVGWMPYTIVESKVLGSATQGVSLNELASNICMAYKGPKEFYPKQCVKLVGEQKNFPKEAAVAQQKENEDDGVLELDIKGDEPDVNVASDGKLQLTLYWRAFCLGCMSFITNPLLQMLRDPEPVPAAGTKFDEATSSFICNKGLVECMGHRYMSCVIEEYPKLDELIEGLACLESKDNKGMTWEGVVDKCFAGEGSARVKKCYDERSTDLLKKHVEERLKVDIPWVPYVLLDGDAIGDAQHGIGFKQLTEEVCNHYSGPAELLPQACQKKRLRADNVETEAPVIKPCPPKKDGAKKPAVYEDAPGIGDRIDTDGILEANALAEGGYAQTEGGLTAQALILPGVCFMLLALVAFRFTGNHKKYA